MTHFQNNRHIILVDGQQTCLLSHDYCDLGILLTVSGPEVVYYWEHEVTELDGSPLILADSHTLQDLF